MMASTFTTQPNTALIPLTPTPLAAKNAIGQHIGIRTWKLRAGSVPMRRNLNCHCYLSRGRAASPMFCAT
jgi:hypothetical protein